MINSPLLHLHCKRQLCIENTGGQTPIHCTAETSYHLNYTMYIAQSRIPSNGQTRRLYTTQYREWTALYAAPGPMALRQLHSQSQLLETNRKHIPLRLFEEPRHRFLPLTLRPCKLQTIKGGASPITFGRGEHSLYLGSTNAPLGITALCKVQDKQRIPHSFTSVTTLWNWRGGGTGLGTRGLGAN